MRLYCAFTPFEWVSSQFYKMAHFGLFLSLFPISTDSPPIQSSYNLSKAEQGKFQTLMNLVTGYCVVPTSFCNSFKMAILRSYFMKMLSQHCWPDSVVTHLTQFCCNNMKKHSLSQSNLPIESEKSIGSTNQLELSRWALNWKRGGEQSIEIERARNFPCISWPERPSVSVSSHFEQQTDFRLSRFSSLPCTARPGKVERCERSIGQSIEIELGGNFLCISWPRAAQREHDLPTAAAAALHTALTS